MLERSTAVLRLYTIIKSMILVRKTIDKQILSNAEN
jgi:hypothetical protein